MRFLYLLLSVIRALIGQLGYTISNRRKTVRKQLQVDLDNASRVMGDKDIVALVRRD